VSVERSGTASTLAGTRPRLRAITRLAAITSIAAAGACNAIVGFESAYHEVSGTDTDAAADGAGAASPDSTSTIVDGSTTTDDGSPADGSPDVSSGGDASPDGIAPDADASVPECMKGKPYAVFCDDFDQPGTSFPLGWAPPSTNNGTLDLAPDGGKTKNGLRAAVTQNGYAQLWKTIKGGFDSKNNIRLTCSIKIETADLLYYEVVAAIRFNGTNTSYYGVAKYINGGCSQQTCVDQTNPQAQTSSDPLPLNDSITLPDDSGWYTAMITVTKNPSDASSSYTGSVKWGRLAEQELDPDASPNALPTPLGDIEIGVGVLYTHTDSLNAADGTVFIDDVLVERF
jgi:hypothetical protein